MVMFKKNLVADLAKELNISKVEAEKRIDSVLNIIADNIVKGNDVKLIGFFNFFVRERKEKEAKNPRTGEPLTIKATKTVVAKLTRPLKRRIKELQ